MNYFFSFILSLYIYYNIIVRLQYINNKVRVAFVIKTKFYISKHELTTAMQYLLYYFFNIKLNNKSNILTLVRFCADHRFKPHNPPFEQIPANSVKFRSCDCTARVEYLCVSIYIN